MSAWATCARVAVTKGKIADILESRGELDEALAHPHARRSCRSMSAWATCARVAVTKGQIADIL